MLDKLRAAIVRYDLLSPGQTIVVGVSGGPDSTALLHALSRLREEENWTLIAAHFHHGFRGVEADADAEYVRALAESLRVTFLMEKADVPAMRRRRHLSAQVAAREARHAFLRRVAADVGAERIALAHTRDDRIETVLLNLLRGTGLEGLQGFPPANLPLVRPLYDVCREDIEAYCAANHLHPRQDSSNTSLDYRRNRIRAELLPYLRTYFNAGVDDAITRMSDLIAADNELLEDLTLDALARCRAEPSDQESFPAASSNIFAVQTLKVPEVNALPLSLRRRVLRQAIASVRGHLQDIGFEAIERILTALSEGQAFCFDLPANTEVRIYADGNQSRLIVAREAAPSKPLPWQATLNVPGFTELPVGGWGVEARVCESGLEAFRAASELPAGNWRILFPYQELTLPLLARSWQPGDRMRWRGLQGSKKLQDLFTDAKIPAAQRHRLPVLVEGGGSGRVLAVAGLRADSIALNLEECRAIAAKILVLTFSVSDQGLV